MYALQERSSMVPTQAASGTNTLGCGSTLYIEKPLNGWYIALLCSYFDREIRQTVLGEEFSMWAQQLE